MAESTASPSLLTGDARYFWGKNPGQTNATAEAERKWEAMEAGEIPWEWRERKAKL